MERIKDFLYDISDLLISLLIIAVIFAVISWKLNESIPIETASAPPPVEAPAQEPDAAQGSDSPQPDSAAATPSASSDAVADASDADKPINEPPATAPEKPVQPPAQPPASTAPTAGTAITIEIPSGSPGITIGKILKDNGLISDVSAFIKKVDELGLGPKLRSGSFKLKTGMSLEQIIKTLANVN